MTICYQGKPIETTAQTLAAFLAERGVDASRAVVEYAGEIYPPKSDLSAVPLKEGAALDVFQIVAGG